MSTPPAMRWFVQISLPRGDYSAGVDPRWIEDHLQTADLPSSATVMFVPGTPREVVDRVAAQARAAGSGAVTVVERLWPPDSAELPADRSVELVDERDSTWEDDEPRFRVYIFYDRPPSHGVSATGQYRATATYDLVGFDVLEVLRWAQERAGDDALYAVALVSDRRGEGRGLVWLAGMDYQEAEDPSTSDTRRRMLRRRGRQLVGPE